ncbi:MAG: DNA ligase D [Gemmatimonadota bacterium]
MTADRLDSYRAKRTPGGTPEPGVAPPGGASGAGPAALGGGLFVIHKHDASRLHWDLRLEMGGVLASWAVPKGPSLDPAEKRLAVHVEDHPLEYVDFEDVIPEGNYGAGPMIVWDRGTWVALEDPEAGLESGKLLFELRGHKLRGVWTLVKLRKTEKEWLLIRERRHMTPADREAAAAADAAVPQASILSGLTVEELGAGTDPSPALRSRLEALGAPRRALRAEDVRLMLATAAERPFSDPDWVFELKLDGYRMLGAKSGPSVRLLTRNGNDATRSFPELVRAIAALPVESVLLDGEVVVHDEAGLPCFQRLQNRARVRRPVDIKHASLRQPATFYAFDLPALLGHDLRPLSLLERKAVLRAVLPPAGPLRYVEHFPERGEAMFERVTGLGLEGVVGKRADGRYRGGRSRLWIKVRANRTDEFVVVGFTEPGGSRPGLGALHLAGYRDGRLVYVGRAGSGFAEPELGPLRETLERLERAAPACEGPVPKGKAHRWTEPELVAEVRYLEWTAEGLLRQPVFVRFRDDRSPEGCRIPDPAPALDEAVSEPDFGPAGAPGLSNPDKVFWPDEGYTKRDLHEYYRAVEPWLLPYLRDRPLVLTRYPDGIEGKSFYQQNAPVSTPEWIRTERVRSSRSEKELDCFVCDDEASLLYLVNLGTIPLHVWASRVGSIERPDWCVLDLDPKGAPFAHVARIARALHVLCDSIQLPNFVKTSGSSGLHVMIPLGGAFTYEQSRSLGELLARVTIEELGEIATIARAVGAREGKVYIDYLQNRAGQLLVAPLSVRPVPGASVSTPLRWREVGPSLDIHRHTIRTVPRRIARMKEDPLAPLLHLAPDLPATLSRLAARLHDGG